MTALSALHTVRSRIGLDDECFRDCCEQITGKRSTREMSDAERNAVRAKLVSDYPNATKRPKATNRLTGPYTKKLQALWISGWNLGLVKNRSDDALIAFVKRQTGIQSMSWLRDPQDAEKAVEALKKWLERAGVDWSVDRLMADWEKMPGYKISFAQCKILNEHYSDAMNLQADLVCKFFPNKTWDQVTPIDWIKIMNHLGSQVRELKKPALKKQAGAR